MQIIKIFISICVFVFLCYSTAFAGGECPMYSSITTAATPDGKFGLHLQYEYSYMKTLREGRRSISPDEVINKKWMMGSSFSAPTEMVMRKYTLLANYVPADRFQLMLAIPYVVNDMDMRMKDAMGMIMDMTMDTVDGLGDITLMGIYNLYRDVPNKPTKSISAGLGIKMPTGENDVRTKNGNLVHAMMQPGTGSWDPIFLINAMHAMKSVSFQFNGLYHMATEGDEGYEFGDVISADLITRYQVLNSISLGLGLNFIHAGRDKDHDGKYSRPATSLIDNIENTGIAAFYISPEVQVRFLNTGGSLLVRFQKPIYQDVNGIQQVVDWRVMASLGWVF